jgi:hypothetical protein
VEEKKMRCNRRRMRTKQSKERRKLMDGIIN